VIKTDQFKFIVMACSKATNTSGIHANKWFHFPRVLHMTLLVRNCLSRPLMDLQYDHIL